MSTTRKIFLLVGLVLGILALFTFGPRSIGGSRRPIVSSGSSMEPGISEGDLVVVRRQGGYRVGDVVAVDNADLGTVLHRIIEVKAGPDGDRFVTKGDNNDFVDSEETMESDVIGEKVLAVPGGGRILTLLPVIAAAGIFVYWVMAARPSASARDLGPPPLHFGVDIVGGAVIVGFGLLGIVAALTDTTSSRSRPADYRSSIDVGWSGEPDQSVVYPDGILRITDPAFLAELDAVDVRADVAAAGGAEDVAGTVALTAVVSDDWGWSHRIDLGRVASIDGGEAVVEGELDLGELAVLVDRVSSRTGHAPGEYEVILEVDALVVGTIAGERFEDEIRHEVPLRLDELALRPDPEATWSADVTGSVAVDEDVESILALGPLSLAVGTARLLAAIGLVLGVVLILRAGRVRAEHEAINHRYAGQVVHVAGANIPKDSPMITVDSFDDIVRMAQMEGSPILYASGENHHWATLAMGVWYRYQLDRAASTPQGAPITEG